jgi:tRNA (guanosine-2'-O-)-methyltransferase
MNVIDRLKGLSIVDVKQYCQQQTIDATVAMINIEGDFNISTMIRNANFFGFSKVYNISPRKKWDKRGSVGTHHYTTIQHFYNEEDFIENNRDRTIIAVENNIPNFADKTVDLFAKHNLYYRPVFVFGSENMGLSNYILENSDEIITLQNYGSVRSLNVGTVSGIVMGFYRSRVEFLTNKI